MSTHAAVTAVTRLAAIVIAAGLVLAPAAPVSATGPTKVETFAEAIQRALDDNCAGLSGSSSSNYQSSLADICAIPTTSAGTSNGLGLSLLTTQQVTAEERRVKERLKDARLALATGQTQAASVDSFQLGRLGLFVSGEYEHFEQDVTRFTAGNESDTKGITFGADYSITKWLIGGIAFNASRTTGAYDEHGGAFSNEALGVMLYASIVPMANMFVDTTVGYNRRDYDHKRRARYTFIQGGVLNIVDGFAASTTRGDEFRTSASAGYDFVIRNLTAGPRVGVNYKTNSVDAFNEHGWQDRTDYDTGLELAFDRQHEDSLTTTLGVFASMAFSLPFGVLVPQVNAEYVHEFMRDQHVVYFRFEEDLNRTRLRFLTESPDRDYANVGAGVSLVFPGGLAGFVNYRALVGYSNQFSHTVTAGLRFAFQ